MAILLFMYMMKDISAMQWRSTKRKSNMDSFCSAVAACCAYVHVLQCSGAAHRHSHKEMMQDGSMLLGGTSKHSTQLYEQGHVFGKMNASVAHILTVSVEQRQ